MKKKKLSRLVVLMAALAFLLCQGAMCPERNSGNDDGNGGGDDGSMVCRPEDYNQSIVTLPEPVPGIIAVGGDGVNGAGGAGGMLEGSYADANVSLKSGGTVDTSFAVSCYNQPDLGTYPWVVREDYTVKVYDCTGGVSGPRQGEYFMCLDHDDWENPDANWIYRMEGGPRVVTGLRVKKGVTLTLGLNYDYRSPDSGLDTAAVIFSKDVIIDGVVSPARLDTGGFDGSSVETIEGLPATSRDSGGLFLDTLAQLVVNGRIDATGKDGVSAGQHGGWGGSIIVRGFDGVWIKGTVDCSGGDGGPGADGGEACYLSWPIPNMLSISGYSYDTVLNGRILARGGSGENGRQGGVISISSSNGGVFNSGLMDVSGGEGFNGDGGQGGVIGFGEVWKVDVESGWDWLHNRGELIARGGDARDTGVGRPVLAGQGGWIDFRTASYITVSGRLDVDGGDAIGWGNGGAGGGVNFEIDDNGFSAYDLSRVSVKTSAILNARGGSGAGEDGQGGAGGVVSYGPDDCCRSYPLSNMRASDQIDVSGGFGDIGGAGGVVHFLLNYSSYIPSVEFVGLESPVQLDGGAGFDGGAGGSVDLSGISISLSVPIYAAGGAGDASAGVGGDGGTITIDSSSTSSVLDPNSDVSPGTGATPGSSGTVTVDGSVIYP